MAFSRSTGPHLTLRRIERRPALIEALRGRRGEFAPATRLAQDLGVTESARPGVRKLLATLDVDS